MSHVRTFLQVGRARWIIRVVQGALFVRGPGYSIKGGESLEEGEVSETCYLIQEEPNLLLTLSDTCPTDKVGEAILEIMNRAVQYQACAGNDVPFEYQQETLNGRRICPHCGKTYKRPGCFGKHVRLVHGIEPATGKPWLGPMLKNPK